jgi:hypothetical protein
VERLVKPEDAAKALTDENVSEVPVNAVREVAAGVKGMAQRAGDRLDVRVVARAGGVRLTVVGRHASHYRKVISDELARRAPQVRTEIRTRVVGRTR